MVPLILMAAGTAMQIAGNYNSNMAQAEQERLNARYYQKQAEYVILSQMRAERLAEFDYTQKIGSQISAYAGSGVDMSGSASVTVGGTISQMIDEMWAIKKKGELDYELANMRGSISSERATTLSSFGYNLTQGATIGINSYVRTNGYGSLNPGSSNSSENAGQGNYLAGQNLLG